MGSYDCSGFAVVLCFYLITKSSLWLSSTKYLSCIVKITLYFINYGIVIKVSFIYVYMVSIYVLHLCTHLTLNWTSKVMNGDNNGTSDVLLN